MTSRLTLLSDPQFTDLQPVLISRMRAAIGKISLENFPSLLDPTVQQVMRNGFSQARAHEGTIWLAESDALVAAYNTGPNAEKMVGVVRQPLTSGLISLVFANEQSICENRVYLNAQQDPTVDRKLGVKTWAMIATPFYLAREVRGVVSCVQLLDAASAGPEPSGFEPEDMLAVSLAASVASQLIDFRLLSTIINWAPGGLA